MDIHAGNQLVEQIKKIAWDTRRPEVLNGLGGFAGLFELPLHRYKRPVLVSSTDGVGTKLKLAIECKQHNSIGIDLVGMCANDLVVMGAEPLFFLDYYATGKLDIETARSVIAGIGQGCLQAGMALIGGETAEMPGMYHANDYDLAGFCVGVIEKEKIIDGRHVQIGDTLLGLASTGPHSNGYSLIRKVLEVSGADLQQTLDGKTLAETLLTPTRIYVKSLLNLNNEIQIHAMAHITGGGLVENLPRVLPQRTVAKIHVNSWKRPAIFNWLQEQGNIPDDDMWRTFNCGIGMVVCVSKNDAKRATELLQAAGETVYTLGTIESTETAKPYIELV